MLAMVADNQDLQLQYAIDAYSFILKIFQISFDYMNRADENKEKYQNAMDNKNSF
jgi:hypothetical protein